MLNDDTEPTVGILGGTGPQGLGLARRFAASGRTVIIGSRDAERAAAAAASLSGNVRGTTNAGCAEDAEMIVVAVPWDGHGELLQAHRDALAGKVVVDCVNPLGFDARGPFALAVTEGSACEQAQSLLPDSRVTGAFHHLSAIHLADPELPPIDSDVLILGDDREAVSLTSQLAEAIPGVRAIFGGTIAQRAPSGSTDREPDRDQPPLQGTCRTPDH